MPMRTLDEWLSLYDRDHQHPTNKLIHWFCVPVILFCVLGMLWCIPWRINDILWLNMATLFYGLVLLFYLRLSFPLFIGFLLIGGFMLLFNSVLYDSLGGSTYFFVLLALFVIAWIFQFIGHKIEGQKPSFLEDMQFLLIGPAWIMQYIFKKMGINFN